LIDKSGGEMRNIVKTLKNENFLKINLLIFLTGLLLTMNGCIRYNSRYFPGKQYKSEVAFSAKVYYIQQENLAFADRFTIFDERGNLLFLVKEKMFTIGSRLIFADTNNSIIFYIKQKVLSLMKQFKIYHRNKLVARIKRKLKIFNEKFTIDVPDSDNYIVKGDFFYHHYSFFRRGKIVAKISKEWNSFRDRYMIQIGPREDDLLILASAIVIDMASHNSNKNDDIGLDLELNL
jgi:uncharacterized protein YxjI